MVGGYNIETLNTNIATNTTKLSNIQNISNWRYQAASYYGSTPTAVGVDGVFFMNHLGGSVALQTTTDTNTKARKYRVQSNTPNTANGSVSGWLGLSTMPPIFVKQGFKVVIGFAISDISTNAPTRSMIGLFKSTTKPTLNSSTTVASITTQSMGIIQESGENVFSFNTRGLVSSTKVATSISCQTPNTTWYTLEMINYVNSSDIIMTLTDQDDGSATQTFTCGITSSTLETTGPLYIQLQRNMAISGGITGSALLQTASFRLWSST